MTISSNCGLAAIACSRVVVAVMFSAPSWNSATTMSASPLAALPSVSCAATRFTAATGSPKSSTSETEGSTSDGVSEVTTPITPTVTPFTSISSYSWSAGSSVPSK